MICRFVYHLTLIVLPHFRVKSRENFLCCTYCLVTKRCHCDTLLVLTGFYLLLIRFIFKMTQCHLNAFRVICYFSRNSSSTYCAHITVKLLHMEMLDFNASKQPKPQVTWLSDIGYHAGACLLYQQPIWFRCSTDLGISTSLLSYSVKGFHHTWVEKAIILSTSYELSHSMTCGLACSNILYFLVKYAKYWHLLQNVLSGSVATQLRWSGRCYVRYVQKNRSGTFLWFTE